MALGILVSAGIAPCFAQREIDVWIGTSSRKPSQGIYHCMLNTETGQLSESSLVAEISGPGFLALHPKKTHLYAVGTLNGKPSVVAYKIAGRGKSAALTLVNSVEVGDGGACHVSVDPTGRTLLSAQYQGGSVAAYSLNKDGSLREQTQLINHENPSGVVAAKQNASHAHWTGMSPDNRFAFVPDLGLDKVVIYRLDAEKSQLTPHGHGSVPPGAGPRHMKFHQSGKWAYVLNELDLSVTVFDYDADAGSMTAKQTVLAVPKSELEKELFKSSSEIRVHPNGQFVYSANRGHDTITAYRVDQKTGELTVIGRVPVRGATPRNFNIDPSGKWLLAAGQDSHTLASFALDQTTGEMTYNRSVITTPSPICVLFE